MRRLLAALFLVLASPVLAADIRGQWKITDPADASYSGYLSIDAQGRVIAVGADRVGPSQWIGYVERIEGSNISLLLTNRKAVSRIRCARQSTDVLNCDTASIDGSFIGGMYYMRRMDP